MLSKSLPACKLLDIKLSVFKVALFDRNSDEGIPLVRKSRDFLLSQMMDFDCCNLGGGVCKPMNLNKPKTIEFYH